MNKKIISSLLVLLLVLAAITGTASAQEKPIEITVEGWPSAVRTGKEYNFTITANESKDTGPNTFTVAKLTYLGTLSEGITLSIDMISIRSVSNLGWSWATSDSAQGEDIVARELTEDPYTVGVSEPGVYYYIDNTS